MATAWCLLAKANDQSLNAYSLGHNSVGICNPCGLVPGYRDRWGHHMQQWTRQGERQGLVFQIFLWPRHTCIPHIKHTRIHTHNRQYSQPTPATLTEDRVWNGYTFLLGHCWHSEYRQWCQANHFISLISSFAIFFCKSGGNQKQIS